MNTHALVSRLLPDNAVPSAIRVLLFSVYYAATAALVIYTWKHYLKRAYRTDWFDVSKKGLLERLSWNPDVRDLMTADPLKHVPRFRLGFPFQALRDLTFLLMFLCVWELGRRGLGALTKDFSRDNLEVATLLVGFLGLVGAATKATYEWRLRARSENRQKWINEIREALSSLIANIPASSDDHARREQKVKTYLEVHGKLELLMNPSEKDHRALMALIRHIYGYDNVPIDDVPRSELGIAGLSMEHRADRIALKSHVIRLSNVVLKREWERVKRIQ